MAEPLVHSLSSARQFGGKPEDYMAIHEKMDCSKKYCGDNRHRALTHSHFWIFEVMEPIFGKTITNSDGKIVSIYRICEQHINEDFKFKFFPNVMDYLSEMNLTPWMNNAMGPAPRTKTYLADSESETRKVTRTINLQSIGEAK
jgi:hypothetical protein